MALGSKGARTACARQEFVLGAQVLYMSQLILRLIWINYPSRMPPCKQFHISGTGTAIGGVVLSMQTYKLQCVFSVLVLVVAIFVVIGPSSALPGCTTVMVCSTGRVLAADMEIAKPPPADLEPSRPEIAQPPPAYLEQSNPSIDDAPPADFELSAPEIEQTLPADFEPSGPEIEEPAE
jgi:hypothetical protein